MDRSERLVFSVAVRSGVSREDAADITQVTFAALLESLSRLRDEERLSSWLMSVARRQTWRIRRKHDQEVATSHPVENVAEPMVDWERLAVVHDGLRSLQPPCRDLLIALYFDPSEPSYAEVAARLGRSIGGIGPMRARCLEHLRALLGEDFEP